MKLHPKLRTWLADAFCPSSRPDLKGDFEELYEYNAAEHGAFKANKKFLSDILSVIPLKFIVRGNLKPKSRIFMLTTNLKIAKRNLVKNKLYSFINLAGLSIRSIFQRSIKTGLIWALSQASNTLLHRP